MAQLEGQKDRYILIDELGSKTAALQAASHTSLRGCAPILSSVSEKPAPDFPEPWTLGTSSFLPLPAPDVANTGRKTSTLSTNGPEGKQPTGDFWSRKPTALSYSLISVPFG